MSVAYIAPIAFVIACWWLSTVVLLYRAALPQETYATTIAISAAAGLCGIVAIAFSAEMTGVAGVYLAFTGSLALWAFLEVSYLLGFITGPRPLACPRGINRWQQFRYGVRASLYHEILVICTALFLAAFSWRAANQLALLTFLVLCLMRWSTKINIFLGVRNLHHEYWPSHLRYLDSYARQRSMNPFFPVSVLVAVGVAGLLLHMANGADADGAVRAGSMVLVTILTLGILEHVFLMMRVPDDLLWRLATRSGQS